MTTKNFKIGGSNGNSFVCHNWCAFDSTDCGFGAEPQFKKERRTVRGIDPRLGN